MELGFKCSWSDPFSVWRQERGQEEIRWGEERKEVAGKRRGGWGKTSRASHGEDCLMLPFTLGALNAQQS